MHWISLLSIERQSRILCGVSSKIWSFCHAHSQSLQLGALKFSPRNIFINSLILKHTFNPRKDKSSFFFSRSPKKPGANYTYHVQCLTTFSCLLQLHQQNEKKERYHDFNQVACPHNPTVSTFSTQQDSCSTHNTGCLERQKIKIRNCFPNTPQLKWVS